MSLPFRLLFASVLLASGLWAAFHWVEADKEIRVLCGALRPGMDMDRARAVLDTGLYLRWRLVLDEGGDQLAMNSRRNLGTSACTVLLENDTLAAAGVYRRSVDLSHVAAWSAIALFAAMALFQTSLAAGAPLGAFAWGGRHRRLPPGLRRGSAAAALLFVAGVVFVLEALGMFTLLGRSAVEIALWALVLVFGLSTLANSASERVLERRTGTPVALVLCLACALVALGF